MQDKLDECVQMLSIFRRGQIIDCQDCSVLDKEYFMTLGQRLENIDLNADNGFEQSQRPGQQFDVV